MERCTIDSASQSTPECLKVSKSSRVTASKFGIIYLYINGKAPEIWLKDTGAPNEAIIMGALYEPHIREWFAKSKWWRPGWTMKEVGSAIPHWDPRIEADIGGLITDFDGNPVAIIVIKAPARIYESLRLTHPQPTPDKNHIHLTHYAQMQGGMAILGIEKCFYIVLGHQRDINTQSGQPNPYKIYVEEVPRNLEFWEDKIYPAIDQYIS